VFSGEGDYDGHWRRLAAGLPNVIFTGWVDVPKIAYMGRVAWCGLAPYAQSFNAFGNKLFEFMAAGLPILLSAGGEANTLIEHHQCGITFESGVPESLVGAIRSLLVDPSRRDALAENSELAYERHYEASRLYREMAEFVLSAAGESKIVR